MNSFKTVEHIADVCVVGGGLAGMCAAISAARHGCRTVLVQDRPVLGGNCSSEIRMWPLGANGSNRRETGIFEELVLENMRCNPTRNWPIWDSVLYGAVKYQDGIELILNCSVNDLTCEDGRITGIKGWQTTTYKWHTVRADIFIDCSGDSVIAELSGAEMRKGREARDEFGESIQPENADSKTMGNSCMIQARETHTPVKYIAPDWARKIDDDVLFGRDHTPSHLRENWWWLELGGDRDTLADCEEIRDDLIRLSYGTWDHVKNGGDHGADNWDLEWAGYLPGKRESRRCIGDHILTQNDVLAGGKFDDTVAYGGWPIDNHPPAGFNNRGEPTVYHKSPSPFGIPYRCLYSVNVENLMFAGRNISVTHAAMAASRVMATCAMLGQAVGTAASVAVRRGVTPRGVGAYIKEVQQTLMDDDCWIPGMVREISDACRSAELSADCANADDLRNGIDRPTDEGGDNGCCIPLGSEISYRLEEPAYVERVRIIFDSDLDRKTVTGGIRIVRDCPTICNRPADMEPFGFPTTMTDSFEVIADGEVIASVTGNRQRLVRIPVGRTVSSIALRPLSTCGDKEAHIFSFDF